jgi:RNA recognition motif-containing protein
MSQVEEKTGHKVFVGNVPYKCTTEEFVECFKDLEGYLSADVIRRHNSTESRGFGFVTFETKKQAEVLTNTDGDAVKIQDRELRFNDYQEDTTKKENSSKVFIRGLPEDVDEKLLKTALAQYGNVLEVTLNCDRETDKCRGSASVTYSKPEEAKAAVEDHETLMGEDTLTMYPFRKNRRRSNYRNYAGDQQSSDAYRAGFRDGRIVGYKEGLRDAKDERS